MPEQLTQNPINWLLRLVFPLLLLVSVTLGLYSWQQRLDDRPQGYERANQLIRSGNLQQARALILELQRSPSVAEQSIRDENLLSQGEWQWVPDSGLTELQTADSARATEVPFSGRFSLGVGELPKLFACEARVRYRVQYDGNDLVINASIGEPEDATPLSLEEMQDIESFVRKERPRWFQPSLGGTVISWVDYRRPGCPDG